MNIKELEKYYKRHLGKKNTIKAYGLIDDDDLLIYYLIEAYNCYAIKHNIKPGRSEMALITNPKDFLMDCENAQQFIDDFKKYIIETVENKYINCKGNEQNGCQGN